MIGLIQSLQSLAAHNCPATKVLKRPKAKSKAAKISLEIIYLIFYEGGNVVAC